VSKIDIRVEIGYLEVEAKEAELILEAVGDQVLEGVLEILRSADAKRSAEATQRDE
jgi:hypothetical protein